MAASRLRRLAARPRGVCLAMFDISKSPPALAITSKTLLILIRGVMGGGHAGCWVPVVEVHSVVDQHFHTLHASLLCGPCQGKLSRFISLASLFVELPEVVQPINVCPIEQRFYDVQSIVKDGQNQRCSTRKTLHVPVAPLATKSCTIAT